MNVAYVELKLREIDTVLDTYRNILQLTHDIYGVDTSKAKPLDEIGKKCIKEILVEVKGEEKYAAED